MLFHVELGLMFLFYRLPVENNNRVPAARVPRLFAAVFIDFWLPLVAVKPLHASAKV